jgi:transcriptional regulator with XRE-family HTH domain
MNTQQFQGLLSQTGMSKEQFCSKCGIDVKSINGWIDGSIAPRPASKKRVADALGVPVGELFPEDRVNTTAAYGEIVNVWAHRSESPKDLWWKLFEGAEEYVDLLGYAMQFFHEDHKDFVALLKDKANDGCQVRIIMADPQSSAANERDHEEDSRGGLVARIQRSLKLFEPVIGTANIDIRLQSYPMYNSIFRFDGEMLVTPHLCHDPGWLAPLFHVRQGSEEGIFQRYLESFDYVFDTSRAIRLSFV